jgi:hypothetical protein
VLYSLRLKFTQFYALDLKDILTIDINLTSVMHTKY